MAAKDHYNWPLVAKQAAELIRNGTAATFPALSRALDIHAGSLAHGFREHFKINNAKELADRLDRGGKVVERALLDMIRDGYGIVMSGKVSLPQYTPADPLPTLNDQPTAKELKWLMISDTHIGSTHAQISALKKIVHIAVNEFGVKHILHSGDLTAGVNMYRGQQNEIYAHGADDQADAALNTLPQMAGVQYYILGGNHDYSFYKQNGHNVVKTVCSKRDDLHYAGFDQVEIPIWANKGKVKASAILWHPSGGVPYALSYRGQKIAAEIGRRELLEVVLEDKPAPTVRWIQWGHLHVSDFFPHGPMWVMGPGCFEGTNSYLKAKGLTPVIQGMVVQVSLTEAGLIQRSTLTPIQFTELQNDYRTGWIPALARRADNVEPIFGTSGGSRRRVARAG